ncbi:ferredoxin [Hyphococcus flavus]|uniref:Ferredoxin n=1 Tax=Hyphococcus flavus TaxID=1866326 RepID=A0AAE9ZGT9_9PROT|nr:ferredoxin [Hyphococcus flavus]WDI32507.1 ferredoxin [Hyphococcus flavus]
MKKPYPRNAPGEFFVADGCCITCGMPVETSPEFFSWDDEKGEQDNHCFVKRQPKTDKEFESVLAAMKAADVGCIYYCGKKEDWKRRLHEAGFGDQIIKNEE